MNVEPDPNPECPKCHQRYTVVLRSQDKNVDPRLFGGVVNVCTSGR